MPQLPSFLLLGAGLNCATLLAAFAAWALAGDALYRPHSRWFRLERAQCDSVMYLALGLYKLGIWLRFVVPWTAPRIVHQGAVS